jgi:hypothetical protein
MISWRVQMKFVCVVFIMKTLWYMHRRVDSADSYVERPRFYLCSVRSDGPRCSIVFYWWEPRWRWSGRQRGTVASQLSSFVVCRLGGSPNHVQPPPRPLLRGPRMPLIQRDGVLLLIPTVPPRSSWRSSWCTRRRRSSSSSWGRALVGNTALKSLRVGQWRLSLWLGCTWRSAGGEAVVVSSRWRGSEFDGWSLA